MTLPLHTSAEVYAIERRLADEHGLDSATLMARAGTALMQRLRANWPHARRVLIVTGPGNNGGDGYVLARLLRAERKRDVQVLALAPARAQAAEAAARQWHEAGGETSVWAPGQGLPQADLIVDGLFGIGLREAPRDPAAALIEAINDHSAPVLAIDVPSGLDADRGCAPGAVVHAERSLCLLARKQGLYTGRAVDLAGRIDFDDLGTGSIHDATEPRNCLLQPADLPASLPRRRRTAHKGDHGHVLVVGGDAGTSGAVRITGAAALRSGAGWVSIATRTEHAATLAGDRPELMVHGIEDAVALRAMLARADVVAVGPGLGQGEWGRSLLDEVLAWKGPKVIDADALNLIAATTASLGDETILTPHPGEAARLLAVDSATIERDRLAAARVLAERYGAIAVLKGAGTVIDDGGRTRVCPFGNPGMASAGMGDALTGVIAALVAQGLSPFEAASTGVLAHALAGDLAAQRGGERGLLASDVIDALREVLNR